MKKEKKNKKLKTETIAEVLKKQSDEKNKIDCEPILEELNEASLNGEYMRTLELKVNQAYFLQKLGLDVKSIKTGLYEISWKEKEQD